MSTDLAVAVHSSHGQPPDPSQSARSDADLDSVVSAPVLLVKRRGGRPPKAPRDTKVYKVCMAVVALRAQGVASKEISETVGYSQETIRTYMKRAVRRGWLNLGSFDDPDDRLEYVLKDKTVRNINELLDNRDKDTTIEAAKGLGMFKTHQVVKNDGAALIGMALSVKVELPSAVHESRIAIRPGTLGGTPTIEIPIDAEIVGEGSTAS